MADLLEEVMDLADPLPLQVAGPLLLTQQLPQLTHTHTHTVLPAPSAFLWLQYGASTEHLCKSLFLLFYYLTGTGIDFNEEDSRSHMSI